MAWQLFRLGRWSFRTRKLVAGLWILLLVLMGIGSQTLAGETNDNFELSGIESTEAFRLIEARAPQASPDGATARLVVKGKPGELASPDAQQAIAEALEQVQTPAVQTLAEPFTTGTVAPDGSVAYATITYDRPGPELTERDRDALEAARDSLREAGFTAYVGGDALNETPEPPLGEVVGIGVAFFVLLLTLGSLVAAGMPLLTALIGVGVGMLGITTLTGFVDLSSTTPALGTMLGLAVGIDYALFIMSRYQHEVKLGRPHEEAAGVAVGTAGSAVVFAGLTVIIALVGLAVCGIGFLTQMGLAAAAIVALSVLIALTLLPALLGFAKGRVTKGHIRGLTDDPEGEDGKETNGLRWAKFVDRFRWPVLVAGVALAAIVSVPVASMELAIPDDGSAPAHTERRQAYDTIAAGFGEGANGPLIVVVDTKGAQDPAAAVGVAMKELEAVRADVAAIVPPVTDPSPQAQAAFGQQLQAVQFATITVIPKTGPSAAETKDLVQAMRGAMADLPAETGARALVTGQTAVGVDISQKLADVFPLYLAVVVGLAFVLLVLVFRSLLVPLKATVGFLLSVGVSLGSTVAVFQWGWLKDLVGLDTTAPIMFLLPILLTGILFGLAMDYEVFLVTRMREAWVHGTPARQAVVVGFHHSARVVVAAAVIMMGVFVGFAFTEDPIIKTIGFALAVGVLADAFLVRMAIVPALMALAGERIWWMPRALDRLVPNLDVEGEALTAKLSAPVDRA